MKTAIITLKIIYNEENCQTPSSWDFEEILDLEPSESVEILSIENEEKSC